MISETSSPLTLTDFFETMYRPLRLAGLSVNTTRLHHNTIGNYAKFLGRPGTLGDLTDELVTRFMVWHIDKGNSPYTANNERNRLLALWRFACRKRLLEIWPDVQLLPEPKRTPRAYSLDELKTLSRACQQVPGMLYPGLRACHWWYALHLVLWDTGERIGAILGLLWTDMDLDGGWLVATAENRKGGRSDRAYKMREETVEATKVILKPVREEVFPWPECETNLYYRYKKILKAAGLPTDRMSKFHRMRKSVGSHFKAATSRQPAATPRKRSATATLE